MGRLDDATRQGGSGVFTTGRNQADAFAAQFARLRRAYLGKQSVLADTLGYSEASVSLWEAGRRLPAYQTLGNLLALLRESGVPTCELVLLEASWRDVIVSRATRPARSGPAKTTRPSDRPIPKLDRSAK